MLFLSFCSVPKNKRRRKADRRHDGRDRRGEYYEEASPTTAAGSSSHPNRDARYTDMAPKWVLNGFGKIQLETEAVGIKLKSKVTFVLLA